MIKRHRCGFAQFSDDGKRNQFVRIALEGDAVLTSHAYMSGSQPTIVFENLTDGEQKKVVAALVGLGRWVEDVQFKSVD